MPSFFQNVDNIRAFSQGFELAGKEVRKSLILEILTYIDEECDIGSLECLIARDGLLTLLNRHKEAIGYLEDFLARRENPLVSVRIARHLMELDNRKAAEEILKGVVDTECPSSQLVKACACLASGILGDEEAFQENWEALGASQHNPPLMMFEEILGEYSTPARLWDLPFSEQITTLYSLAEYGDLESLNHEAFGLIESFETYVTALRKIIIEYSVTYGLEESADGRAMLRGICRGGLVRVTSVLEETGAITDTRDLDEVPLMVARIGSIADGLPLIDDIAEWDADYDAPADALVRVMKEKTGGNEDLIRELVADLAECLPEDRGAELTGLILKEYGGTTRFNRVHLDALIRSGETEKALAFLKCEEISDMTTYERLELEQELDPAGSRPDIQYEILRSQVFEGGMNHKAGDLVNEALMSGKMDDLISNSKQFRDNHLMDAVALIDGYRRIKQGDLKHGMEEIKRLRGKEIPDNLLDLILARIFHSVKMEKRARRICEDLLRKGFRSGEVADLLAEIRPK